jgi:hypothetical protein
MTPEDLQALRAIIREEITGAITASEQRLRSEITGVEQRLRSEITAVEERITHATAANLSDLRNELVARFESTDRRLERLELQMHSIILQTAGVNKSLTDAERLDSATAATLAAQQRAIGDLYNQIAEIKRRLPQQQQ